MMQISNLKSQIGYRLRWGTLAAAMGFAATLCAAAPADDSPEAKALAFLSREVPSWSQKNKCFSCHNNGDGARALYRGLRQGYNVVPEALTATTAWLSRPVQWDQDVGDAEFKDIRLARIQFAAALVEAVQAGQINDRRVLAEVAELLAKDQSADGSWQLVTGGVVAAPATYGSTLATHLARRVLQTADETRYRQHLARSEQWLEQVKFGSVLDAAAILWAVAPAETPAARDQKLRALDLLRRAQSTEGGWGPYLVSAPEPFDTAVSLLALQELRDKELDPLIRHGRAWLVSRQQANGSWPATTRPAGVDSYAQYISTTAWSLQALLATSPKRP
jgi:hypothetical protein